MEPPLFGFVERSPTPDSYAGTDSDDSVQRYKYKFMKHASNGFGRHGGGSGWGGYGGYDPSEDGPVEDDEDYLGISSFTDAGVGPPAAPLQPTAPAIRPLNPALFPMMFLQPNEARGDCQFHALAQALNGYRGSVQEQLQTHLNGLGLVLGAITGPMLRKLAYQMFLAATPELDEQLRQWKLMASDPSLAGVYDHALFLRDKRVDLLTLTERQQLYTCLMNPGITWGDETSLYILERLLRVRVDVITGYGQYLQTRDTKTTQEPLVFMCMHLSHQHYECVLVQHPDTKDMLSAWAKAELPPVIVGLHKSHCGTAVQPHIRMDDAWLGAVFVPGPFETDVFLAHFHACKWLTPAGETAGLASSANLAVAEDLVDGDGGWQYPGEMLPMVCMLQCGLRAANWPPVAAPLPTGIVDRLPNATMPRLY
jgi:hypothetical protein